jgi:hypothetical protein
MAKSKIQFQKIVLLDTPYSPEKGSFARAKKIIGERHKVDNWFYCRDIFHGILWNLKIFFFSHPKGKGRRVAAFMQKIEEIIDVQPRSEYGPTQIMTFMWIRPSVWWTKYGMRRSLFTILLRAGLNYIPSKDNFKEAARSEKYLGKTPYAFERFISGFTKYAGHKHGWYKQFCDMQPTDEEVNKLLVKPLDSSRNKV